jgi:hypothetical protein
MFMFIIIGVLTEKVFFTGGSGYIGSPCVVELMELAIWLFLARSLGRLAASGSDSIQLRYCQGISHWKE